MTMSDGPGGNTPRRLSMDKAEMERVRQAEMERAELEQRKSRYKIGNYVAQYVFRARPLTIGLFIGVSLVMMLYAALLRVDAGFEKQLPTRHPFTQTLRDHPEFAGANRVLVVLEAEDGNIFSGPYLKTLREVTEAVGNIPGVDKGTMNSLWTPNVRFIEVNEEGFSGGNVIPGDFPDAPSADQLAQVRDNVIKAGIVGRLVAEDYHSAAIIANLNERDPNPPYAQLDVLAVGKQLEAIRTAHEKDGVRIHIIGYAKAVSDIAEGAKAVVVFFIISILLSIGLVWFYARSLKLALLPIGCSLVAVVWQLGLLSALGFGIDPMSILLPFLIFAIGTSHGVQMINGVAAEIENGHAPLDAAREAFGRLLVPGVTALVTALVGFLTLLLIDIPMIRELAITACLGVAVLMLTNLVLLPLLLSYFAPDAGYIDRVKAAHARLDPLWNALSRAATIRPATAIIVFAILVGVPGWYLAHDLSIGDTKPGVPELRENSRYNRDTAYIVSHYAIGVDVMQVIAIADKDDACVDPAIVRQVDDLADSIGTVDGVRSVMAMPQMMKLVNAGWNEGSLKWRVLARDPQILVQSARPIETSTGLIDTKCRTFPVVVYLTDHRAGTIERVVAAVQDYVKANPGNGITYKLATGNAGVMHAQNEAVREAQWPMLIWVYISVIVFCLIAFQSVRGMISTILPLVLVSILTEALMYSLQIGLKVATLPVAALGVGIGVDYGIYIFSRLKAWMADGLKLADAYRKTLQETGSAVLFTGITLAAGVSTWIISPLKFQGDMGLLLTFVFLMNMLGAVLLLPAIAAFLYVERSEAGESSDVTRVLGARRRT